jgi:uncharacterized membrane protein
MSSKFEKVKQNCISGILFLLPLLILLVLIQKVFGYFARFGGIIAKIIGFDQIMGEHAANFLGELILLAFVYLCGYLVRMAFFKRMSDSIDAKLKEVIPGYEKHKEMAHKQLVDEPKDETDIPVLIQLGEYWQPGFLLEQNSENAVVNIPHSEVNEIYIVPIQKIKILKETTLSDLKTVIKDSGKGLLECK